MPRIAKIVIPGYSDHVTQRGVRSMDIFLRTRVGERIVSITLLGFVASGIACPESFPCELSLRQW